MIKIVYITIFSLAIAVNCFGQDKIKFRDGKYIKGKIKYVDDTLLIIKAPYKNDYIDYRFNRSRIVDIDYGRSRFELLGGKQIEGSIHEENSSNYILVNVKSLSIDTLILPKKSVLRVTKKEKESYFLDIGFLRGGGALVGLDLEIVTGYKSSIYIAGGFKGYGAGINFFFGEDHKGAGFKFGYNNQGIGSTYVGKSVSGTFFYKMRPGLSIDLGLGYIIDSSGRFNYGGKDILLWYGIGYRF